MSKNLTSTWLRGLGKLAQMQLRAFRNATKRGERAVADMAKNAKAVQKAALGGAKSGTGAKSGAAASKKSSAKGGARAGAMTAGTGRAQASAKSGSKPGTKLNTKSGTKTAAGTGTRSGSANAGKRSTRVSAASGGASGSSRSSGASGSSISKASKPRLSDPLGLRLTIGEIIKSRRSGAARPKTASGPAAQTPRAASTGTRARSKPVEPRESRVRPSRHAWVRGDWSRSFHSAPPAPGDLISHLAYGIYVPPKKGNGKRPLVVMLHGCKQTSEEFAQGTRMNSLADECGFVVLYPEQSRIAHPHRCWHWYDASDRTGGQEARSIVSLVDAVSAREDIDPTRVYVAGMSAGAGMAALLAIRYPERFAAVALHSGPVFGDAHSAMSALATMRRGTRDDPLNLVAGLSEFQSHPGMPAIIVHGEHDDVVSPRNADQLAMQFVRLNRLVDSAGRRLHGSARDSAPAGVVRHDWMLDDVPIVRDCRIADLRHAWSGGDGTMPFHVSDGPDSSRLIYEFFRLHRRPAAIGNDRPEPLMIA